jgi:hypothetical protein
MIGLALIGLGIVVFLFLMFKLSHFKNKLSYFLLFIGIAFIILTIYLIYSGANFSFASLDDTVTSIKIYFSWFGNAVKNVWHTTGYFIKQDWSMNATAANLTK